MLCAALRAEAPLQPDKLQRLEVSRAAIREPALERKHSHAPASAPEGLLGACFPGGEAVVRRD